MPRVEVIERTLYKYSELSDKAKAKARDWYRELEANCPVFDVLDSCRGDFEEICKILGIELATHDVTTMSGNKRTETNIWYSGFSCQGDGAQFEGRYAYAKGAHKAIRKYAPNDIVLHQVADDLMHWQKMAAYKLVARIKSSGHYSNAYCTDIEVFLADDEYANIATGCEVGIRDALRRLMNWMYRTLETEYNWRHEDEQVVDAIEANEYEFTEDGRRA